MTLLKRTGTTARPTTHPMFSNILENFFNNDWGDFFGDFEGETVPAVNVKEDNENYNIEVAAPGMEKKDFDVSVENGVLNISAQHEERDEDKNDNYTRREFSYRSFKRSFTLPESVKDEDIQAKYEDGILRITIPKKEEAKKEDTKKIEIN